MRIFKHINSNKTIGITFKVLNTFFDKNQNFEIINDYEYEKTIIDYFLIRHPTDRFISFYKNKLCDGIGFKHLSREFIWQMSSIVKTNLNQHRNTVIPKEILKKFKNEVIFRKIIENIHVYKKIERHLYPQIKNLNFIKYKNLIKIENDLHILQKEFPEINFNLKLNSSNKNEIFHYLTSNLEQILYKEYSHDYILGNYKTYLGGIV